MSRPVGSTAARIEEVAGGRILVGDSVTDFSDLDPNDVVICGSHGGRTAALFGVAAGAKGLVLNDAGGGKDDAGRAGLPAVEVYRVAAATVSHLSARIGSGLDTWESGRVSAANRWAWEAGVRPGQMAQEAARRLAAWSSGRRPPRPPSPGERPATVVAKGPAPAVVVDSASMIDAALVGAIVVTGSHGGMVGGRAVRAAVAAAFFNDAGVGKDGAGISRLPVLDSAGIAGATAGHDSARIGESWETYAHGILSHVNTVADAHGVAVGMRVRAAVELLSRASRGGAGLAPVPPGDAGPTSDRREEEA